MVAQGPGESEEAGQRYLGSDRWESAPPQPLIGRTGRVLERYLQLAGLAREDVSLANTVRCRWNHRNELPPADSVLMRQAAAHCTRAHWKPPEGVKLYVAMGEHAFTALTGFQHDFNGWRGYMLPYRPITTMEPLDLYTQIWVPKREDPVPVLVTHHLAYLWKEPEAELPTKRDWNKIPQILDGKWPVALPPIIADPPEIWPSYSAFDTEFHEFYTPDGVRDEMTRLVRYSLATKDRLWCVEAKDARVRIPTLEGTTLVMHNAPADLPHARKLIDLSNVTIEDTMYAHSVLWTGKVETDDQKGKTGGAMSHTLNFLGSMYGRLNRWKHLADVSPRTYAAGDAFGTLDVWQLGLYGGIRGELERDPQSMWVYTNLRKPLVPIILKHAQHGIAVDHQAADVALKGLIKEQAQFELQARAYAGFPLNLRSPKQLAWWLYDVEGLKAKRSRR